MSTSAKNHDTLVFRLSQILIKLNQGVKVDPQNLAEEFGVNLRTIQRDLNERFSYLPLQKKDGKYSLDPAYLGKLNSKDIEKFATLAGIKGLFPSLSNEFLSDIFDSRIQNSFLVKGHNYENLSGKEKLFKDLENSISSNYSIDISYRKSEQIHKYFGLHPYKLVNSKGIWYLAAAHDGKIKTFSFAKIESVSISQNKFMPDPKIIHEIQETDDIYFGAAKHQIVLKINSDVATYFKRRKLLPNQIIDKELFDGSLIVTCTTSDINHALAVVRYWIPAIKIISPNELHTHLRSNLTDYLIAQ